MPEKTARRSSAPSLSSLVASATAEAEGAEALASRRPPALRDGGPRTVPLRRLKVRPGHNPRQRFDEERLRELAATVAAGGIVQPVAVEPDGDSGEYWVLQGERRYRALRLLLADEEIADDYAVPVYVRTDLDAEARLVAALVENLQRKELNPVEEAEAFEKLRRDHGRSTAEIARLVGRSRRHVQARLQLLALAPQVRRAVLDGEVPATVARVLAGAPDALQVSALEHYRAAPASLRTEEALRKHLRARLVPVDRAIFPVELYEETHEGPIWVTDTGGKDPGSQGRYFADPQLFLRLQKAALRDRRDRLRERFEWVEILEAKTLPPEYEEAGDGPGAVILVRNGLYDVQVIEGVREAGAAAGREDARAAGSRRAAEPPPADEVAEPPTATRLARAGRLRTRALQESVASDSVSALRAALVGLLAGGPSAGLCLDPEALRRRPEPPPTVARGLDALAHAVGVESAEALLDPEAPGRPGEAEMYHRLLSTPRGVLVRMFAAVVAATIDAGSAVGGEPTLESPGLACELAHDLDTAVTDWRPSRRYFREFSLEELRAVAVRVGVDLPAGIAKDEAIERLLASERIGEYSPPELLFRPPPDASE